MAPFAGFNMPISYKGIQQEHMAVRQSVGMFDVSHMGEFFIEGPDALALLQQTTSNDVSKLIPGKAQYSCLPNNVGGIIDDLIVYRLPDERSSIGGQAYMLVVNASNIDKDWNWIKEHRKGFKVDMRNESDNIGLLAVQGPKAIDVLQRLTTVNLADIKFYHFEIGTIAGIPDVILSGTGYTGAGGFELYAAADRINELWDKIMEAGQPEGIQPVGLGARDTLRLEMGFCLYGNDIDDTTSPIEARLGWITKVKKGTFNSVEIFKKQKQEGVNRKLVGFKVSERRVPRNGYVLINKKGEEIGKVTSGSQSPNLGHPIGMGYVKTAYAEPGTIIGFVAGKKQVEAEVVKPPFIAK